MRQITVNLENRVGSLADICEALGKVGVNIKSISAQGEGNKGVVRLVTEDEMTSVNALEKAGFRVHVGDVMVLKLSHKPGEMAKIARKLANNKINIECVYMMNANKDDAEIVIKPEDVKAAAKALE